MRGAQAVQALVLHEFLADGHVWCGEDADDAPRSVEDRLCVYRVQLFLFPFSFQTIFPRPRTLEYIQPLGITALGGRPPAAHPEGCTHVVGEPAPPPADETQPTLRLAN